MAHDLLASVDDKVSELSAGWAEELEKRLDSDSSRDRPAAEVMAELDAKHGFA